MLGLFSDTLGNDPQTGAPAFDVAGDAGASFDVAGLGNYGGGSGGTNYASGWLQAMSATAGGYLSKRLDIDLQQRYFAANPQLSMTGTGQRILVNGQMPKAGGVQVGQAPTLLNLDALLPFIIVAGIAFAIARAKNKAG